MANTTALPLWVSPVSLEDLGGGLNKRNYAEQPVVNPETDVDCKQYNGNCDATANMSRTSEFARLQATLGAPPSITSYRGQHGIGLTHAPSIARLSPGLYRLTWSSTYTDRFGQVGAINLKTVRVQVHGSTPLIAQPTITGANTVEVRVWNMSSTLVDTAVGLTVSVGVE